MRFYVAKTPRKASIEWIDFRIMNSRIFFLFIGLLSVVQVSARGVVVDSISRAPLPMASIFNCRGNIVGLTDNAGRLPAVEPEDYPLTLRYMGYQSAIVNSTGADTICLRESVYELPELTVGTGKRTVLYMSGYIREYSTLTTYTDTVVMFREKSVDFMVPGREEKKFRGWQNQRILSSRSYYKLSNNRGLDSVSDRFGRHFSWGDWVGVIKNVPIPRALSKDSVATDTIMGKYSPATIWRRSGDKITLNINVLADTINRKWLKNLWAFNNNRTEFTALTLKYCFDNVSETELMADNLSSISFNIESRGRGPSLSNVFDRDEPFFVSTYVEMYITDRRFITVKEARRLEKNLNLADNLEIKAPEEAPALQQAIGELVARVESIDHESRRKGLKVDERIGGYKHGAPPRHGPIGSLVNMVKQKVKKWRGY